MQDLCNILRCKGFYISPSKVSSNLYYHIRCVCSSMPKLPKIKNLGAFSVYVITKWPKFRHLHHPCYTCLILLHPTAKVQNFMSSIPPPLITKIVNGVVFLFHKHQLESALINVRKNVLLIWRFPMFPWIQFYNHQFKSGLINTRKNVWNNWKQCCFQY